MLEDVGNVTNQEARRFRLIELPQCKELPTLEPMCLLGQTFELHLSFAGFRAPYDFAENLLLPSFLQKVRD